MISITGSSLHSVRADRSNHPSNSESIPHHATVHCHSRLQRKEFDCELLQKVIDLNLIDGIDKEVIIVDDGSTDQTYQRLETFITKLDSSIIRLHPQSPNQGKGAAIRTGFSNATGDIPIVQDADLEYDPDDINDIVRAILDGESVVYGSRILREKALNRSGICGWITGKHPHSYVLAYLRSVLITSWMHLRTEAKLTLLTTAKNTSIARRLNRTVIESAFGNTLITW